MPDERHYETFLALQSAGRKQDAATAIRAFIASFGNDDDRAGWTRRFLATHPFGERIRHELYADVIFPVLKAGYEVNDPWCLYWLAGSSQNLYAAALWQQVAHQSPLTMLRRAYANAPDSDDIRHQLLSAQLDLFARAAHEWPHGILNGMNDASAADCDGYLADATFARTLAPSPEQAAFLATFEHRVLAYRDKQQCKA